MKSTPKPLPTFKLTQKFQPGMLVRIAADLGPDMDHFEKDCYAVVEFTYKQRFGNMTKDAVKSYSLTVRDADGDWSSSAWYHEDQLTLVTDREILRKCFRELKRQGY